MAADAFYSDLSEEIDFCLSGVWTRGPEPPLHVSDPATRGRQTAEGVRVKSNFKHIISLCDGDINDNTIVSCPFAPVLICVRLCPPGQSAQDDVRVGSVSGPGGAQPLRCLETTRHLCLQHRADPLTLNFCTKKNRSQPGREHAVRHQVLRLRRGGRRRQKGGGVRTAHGRNTEEWS